MQLSDVPEVRGKYEQRSYTIRFEHSPDGPWRTRACAFKTPFLAAKCHDLLIELRTLGPIHNTDPIVELQVCLYKGDFLFLETISLANLTHAEGKTIAFDFEHSLLLSHSNVGDVFVIQVAQLKSTPHRLTVQLCSKRSKTNKGKTKVINNNPIRPAVPHEILAKYGFLDADITGVGPACQRTVPVERLRVGDVFVLKNVATSNLLSYDQGGYIASMAIYDATQLWRVRGSEENDGDVQYYLTCGEGLNASDAFVRFERFPSDPDLPVQCYGILVMHMALDECIQMGYQRGEHRVVLERQVHRKQKQLWMIEYPHQPLLTLLYGSGLLSLPSTSATATTASSTLDHSSAKARVLSDANLMRIIAHS